MIFKDIVTKKNYTKDGQEKATWLNVGTYKKTDDGKEYIELNMFPNTQFYVFEKTNKTTVQKDAVNDTVTTASDDFPEGLDLSKIPF
jgi:hypothetical protein